VFPLLWDVVEKVAAVFRFLSNKIKLPHKRKKEEKKHETQNKKISATPPNFFGRLAVFHSLTHGRTKSSETKFEPRIRIRFDCLINSFREKKGNNTLLLKKKRFLQSNNNTFEEKKSY
jgi:hypothetical protein